MLSVEDNAMITQVGPGKPVGELFRRFWLPALLSSELPEPDCEPVRLVLMGEELIVFRDSHGRIGCIDAYCPHRGAPLFFGRNELDGLRCIYHGWKFDVNGACVDMPNCVEGSELSGEDQHHELRGHRGRRTGLVLHGAAGQAPPGSRLRVVQQPAQLGRRRPSTSTTPTTCRRWRATSTRAMGPICTAPWTATRATRPTSSLGPPAARWAPRRSLCHPSRTQSTTIAASATRGVRRGRWGEHRSWAAVRAGSCLASTRWGWLRRAPTP